MYHVSGTLSLVLWGTKSGVEGWYQDGPGDDDGRQSESRGARQLTASLRQQPITHSQNGGKGFGHQRGRPRLRNRHAWAMCHDHLFCYSMPINLPMRHRKLRMAAGCICADLSGIAGDWSQLHPRALTVGGLPVLAVHSKGVRQGCLHRITRLETEVEQPVSPRLC